MQRTLVGTVRRWQLNFLDYAMRMHVFLEFSGDWKSRREENEGTSKYLDSGQFEYMLQG